MFSDAVLAAGVVGGELTNQLGDSERLDASKPEIVLDQPCRQEDQRIAALLRFSIQRRRSSLAATASGGIAIERIRHNTIGHQVLGLRQRRGIPVK